MTQAQIKALLVEREGLVRRGLKDRVRQVEDILVVLGWEGVLLSSSPVPSEDDTSPPIKKPSTKKAAR